MQPRILLHHHRMTRPSPSASTSAIRAWSLLPLLLPLLLSFSSSIAAAPTAPPSSSSSSSSSSSCSDSSGSASSCIGSTSAAAVVALIFVGVVCFFLLLWCSIRVLAGCQPTAATGNTPTHPPSSLCCFPWRRHPASQVHLHLHPGDSPTSLPLSSPTLPWSLTPYPFVGNYRIGRNSHLSPFTLLAHFHPLPYPRRLTGSGVDGGTAFAVVDGVWTVEGEEHRCVFRELFEDGSGYLFTGQCGDGEGGRWKGHWWKEGGAQTGVWSMQPDEERWKTMREEEERRQMRREEGDAAAWLEEGEQRGGALTESRERRRSLMVRGELEEQKEVTAQGHTLDADVDQRERPTASLSSAEVAIEMIAMQQQPHVALLSFTAPSFPLSLYE